MDLAFRALSGGQFPNFRTLSDFRKEHLEAFHGLFLEVLRMCREAGLVRMGHLSLDGTKYQANASKRKAIAEPVHGLINQACGFSGSSCFDAPARWRKSSPWWP